MARRHTTGLSDVERYGVEYAAVVAALEPGPLDGIISDTAKIVRTIVGAKFLDEIVFIDLRHCIWDSDTSVEDLVKIVSTAKQLEDIAISGQKGIRHIKIEYEVPLIQPSFTDQHDVVASVTGGNQGNEEIARAEKKVS